jgi:hypothetical protein
MKSIKNSQGVVRKNWPSGESVRMDGEVARNARNAQQGAAESHRKARAAMAIFIRIGCIISGVDAKYGAKASTKSGFAAEILIPRRRD